MLKKFAWTLLFSLFLGLVGCNGGTETKEVKGMEKVMMPPAGMPGGPKLKEGESPKIPLIQSASGENQEAP